MRKFWLVVFHEYSRHVYRKRFILNLLTFPAFVLIATVVILIVAGIGRDAQPIGYVDNSRFVKVLTTQEELNPNQLISKYDSEKAAQSDLFAGIIEAYYVLEEDFPTTSGAKLVALSPPNGSTQSNFENLIRNNLTLDYPQEIITRLQGGNHIVITSIDGRRHYQHKDRLLFFTPILGLFVFFLAILSTSGYLMHAVTEEKENRTIEMMITSISPAKMMVAKITGIIGIGITLLLFWIGLILLAIFISPDASDLLLSFRFPLIVIVIFITTILLAFTMIAAIIAAVGSIVTEATEGQQITGPFSVPFIIPYFFLLQILTNPNSNLAVIMSYIPFTAPTALLMRVSFADVPREQILISLAIQIIFTVVLVWAAGYLFRLGMLHYGRHLTWRDLFPKKRVIS